MEGVFKHRPTLNYAYCQVGSKHPPLYVLGRPSCPPPVSVISKYAAASELDSLWSERGSLDDELQRSLTTLLADNRDNEVQIYDRRQRRKGSVSTSSGPADDSENVVGMVDEYCDLYSLDPAHENAREQTELYDRSTMNILKNLKIYPPAHVLSAKRGRRYDDIWEEEDFYAHIGNDRRTINDWTDLINTYNDDFDCPYINWLVATKRDFQIPLVKKMRSDDPKGPYIESRNSVSSGTSVIVAPPVPVSCHHPACWGPGWRRRFEDFSFLQCNGKPVIDVACVHPASVSSALLPLSRRGDGDLLDEIEIISAVASSRLQSIAEFNRDRLIELHPKVNATYTLSSLENWKLRLQNCLDSIVGDVMIPKSDRLRIPGVPLSSLDVTYLNLNPVPDTFNHLADDSTGGEDPFSQNFDQTNVVSDAGFCSPPTLPRKENSFKKIDCDYECGQIIEVLTNYNVGVLKDAVWVLGRVVRVISDGPVVRYVKVRPACP